MKILEAHPFHVTRDADSEIQDLEAGDLLESVEEGVWQRRFADVVRVEVDEAMPAAGAGDPDQEPGTGARGHLQDQRRPALAGPGAQR